MTLPSLVAPPPSLRPLHQDPQLRLNAETPQLQPRPDQQQPPSQTQPSQTAPELRAPKPRRAQDSQSGGAGTLPDHVRRSGQGDAVPLAGGTRHRDLLQPRRLPRPPTGHQPPTTRTPTTCSTTWTTSCKHCCSNLSCNREKRSPTSPTVPAHDSSSYEGHWPGSSKVLPPLTPSLTAIGQCRQTHWRKLKSSYGNSPSSTRRWPLDNFEEPSNKYKKSSTRQGDSLTRWGRIPTLPTGTKRWRASAMWPMKRMPGTGSGRRRRGLYTHGHHSPAGGSGQNHHIPGPHARGLHQR